MLVISRPDNCNGGAHLNSKSQKNFIVKVPTVKLYTTRRLDHKNVQSLVTFHS